MINVAFLKKRWVLRTIVIVVLLGVGAFLTVVAGVIPVKASANHWAITSWFLHFAMRRSIATHTIGMKLPSLADPMLVLKGAGHFEMGCRPCHGGPGEHTPRVAHAMLPPPPELAPQIASWTDEELFYIVKHGIKMTGMPAWPSQRRDDEVHAMVAFLKKLPELDAPMYRRLVYGEGTEVARTPGKDSLSADGLVRPARTTCARCHGLDGLGRGIPAFPRLAGQPEEYLAASLTAFASAKRASGTMEAIAAALSAADLRALANHFSSLPAAGHRERATPANAGALARGEAIALKGIPSQDVPSCQDCHGPGAAPRNPGYPRLAGQYADYLVLQLELFRDGRRGGSRLEHIMRPLAGRMSPDQIRDVALYYEALAPAAELRP
jgi:cytochrome c553